MSPYAKNLDLDQSSASFSRKNIFNIFSKRPSILNIILLVFIFITIIFYLIEMNQIMTFGFKLKELEKQKEELEKVNKTLKLEKIELESLNDVQIELSSLDLVKIEKLDYLRPMAGVALTRK